MDLKAYNNYVNEVVYPAISKCSLGLAIIVLLTMIILTIYDFKLVDRVTLRLQTGITCYDIWLHSLPLWNRPYNYEGSPLCTFIAYQLFSFPLFYCFLNAAIGLNLQLIFLHNIKVTREIELGYWLGTVGLTLLVTLPPLAMGVVGFGSYDQCYIASSDETYGKLLNFFTNIFIMILCMIYLLTIVILVSFQHYRQVNRIRKHGEAYGDLLSKKDIKQISRLISRISLYPLVMIMTHSGLVISQTAYDLFDFTSDKLEIVTYLAGSFLGMFNFLVFFLDPTIHHALRVIYYRVVKKQEINQEIEETNIDEEFELAALEINSTDNLNIDIEYQNMEACRSLIKSL